jgi:8-oxo-dGTP pyrophosphatase MutT (NUDIX family)
MQLVNNPSILNRAGLIPFYIDNDNQIKMLFMVPTENEWIDSVPQVSKGRIEPSEMTLKAALREAKEELGLKQSNLTRIEPVGQFSTIMFYVGQITDPTDFDPFDEVETQYVIWMTKEDYESNGRQLHLPVVEMAVEKIKEITGQ